MDTVPGAAPKTHYAKGRTRRGGGGQISETNRNYGLFGFWVPMNVLVWAVRFDAPVSIEE